MTELERASHARPAVPRAAQPAAGPAPLPEPAGGPPPGAARGVPAGRLARGLAGLVRVYQRWLSPALPRRCRFWPTCSEYARLAILRHGVLRGGALALRRLLRCHPLGRGGIDPPPP